MIRKKKKRRDCQCSLLPIPIMKYCLFASWKHYLQHITLTKRNQRLVDFLHVNLLTQTRFNKWYTLSCLTFCCNLNVKIISHMEIRVHILFAQGLFFEFLFVLLEHYVLTSCIHFLLTSIHSSLGVWVLLQCEKEKEHCIPYTIFNMKLVDISTEMICLAKF